MFGRKRPAETPPDVERRHETVLDLIEQVTALRGQVRALEAEWLDMRAQIKKGYQRMEKAYERAQVPPEAPAPDPQPELGLSEGHGFARKLRELKGA